jgi:ATP synthase I chain
MTEDVDLLAGLARRNWIILGALVLLSLLWRELGFTLGVLGGGLLALTSYRWLHRSLSKLLSQSGGGSTRGFQFGYLLRLVFLAAALYLLIAVAQVHPVGLALGLSVVVLNILWTTLKRAF